MTTSALLINRDKWCFQAGAHGTQVGSWRRPLHSNLPPLLLLRNSCNNKLAHLASRHSHTIYLVCWHLALSSIYLSFMLILWYFSLFKDFLFWVIFLSDTDFFLSFTVVSPLYWVNIDSYTGDHRGFLNWFVYTFSITFSNSQSSKKPLWWFDDKYLN